MALKPGITDMEHDPQLSADYRAAADEMPPTALDDRIRAAARREAGAGPRRQSRWSAWQVPVSLAAVVVLSVTVVLMMRDEGVDRVEPDLPPPVAEALAPQSAAEPAAQARIAEAPMSSRPQALPPAVTGDSQAKPAPLAEAAPAVMAKSQPAAEVPVPAATVALRDESAAERNVAPARETARPMLRSAPTGAAADVAAGPAARVAAPAAAMSAPAPDRVLWHDLMNEPAGKWVQRIVEWRRAGRTADADVLLAEFRRRFPEHPLPDEAAAR
jgi:hypothetical protein